MSKQSGSDIKFWLVLIFSLSFILRLLLNFSQELIPGVNGGYYPLQVRSVLENGHLGFSDMPLLFYVNASIIKFISLFGFPVTDGLILNVVKVVDGISLPLSLVPLYKILRLSNSSKTLQISILAFSVLSFSPLILTSDLQKNALAITFLFASVANFISFQFNKRKFEIVWVTIFLILTGLTHFGTFIFGLFFLLTILIYTYKKRAIIPVVLIAAIGLGVVSIFDISRFSRVLSVGSLIFEKPAILNGTLAPPDMLVIFFSILLVVYGFLAIKKKSTLLSTTQKAFIFASIVCLLTCSFPFLDSEYFKRLSLFLFIPQILLILQITTVISVKQLKTISISFVIFTLLSIITVFGHPKETVIDKIAYEELRKLKSVIKNDNETIVIARHGLEWWTAWALHTKVGQDKAIDSAFFEKYKNVIFITQINGFSKDGQRTPFHEPILPENSEIIFSSEYFKIFKLNKIQ